LDPYLPQSWAAIPSAPGGRRPSAGAVATKPTLATGKLLARHCVGGPPAWIGTDVRFTLEATADGGPRILLDHTGFREVDEMFRMVSLGWARMLLQLQRHTETGAPAPYFQF
jgi:hypothetical protein